MSTIYERPFRVFEDTPIKTLYNFLGRRDADDEIRFSTACALGEIFRRDTHVLRVELFGTPVRKGAGSDLGVVFVLDRDDALHYCDEVRYAVRSGAYAGHPWFGGAQTLPDDPLERNRAMRLGIARKFLGDRPFNRLEASAPRLLHALDVVIFPPDWRDDTAFLAHILPHQDPRFVERIARDALRMPWERPAPEPTTLPRPLKRSEVDSNTGFILVRADNERRRMSLYVDGVCNIVPDDRAGEDTVRVVWSQSGTEFPPRFLSLSGWALAEGGQPGDSRAFPYSQANYAFLLDMVRRGVYEEYRRLIRPTDDTGLQVAAGVKAGRTATSDSALDIDIASSGGMRPEGNRTRKLIEVFQDPRHKVARRMIARRSRNATEDEEVAPKEDNEEKVDDD